MKTFLVASALLVATPALAQTPPPAPTPAEGEAAVTPGGARTEEPQAERRICRTISATESRVRARRVCLTEAEWREQYRQER